MSVIEQRAVGRTGRTISAIGLGTVTFGREIDEEASYKLMDHAMENGVTFFDTAEGYGGGQSQLGRKQSMGVEDQREVTTEMSSSEKIIGRWLRKRGGRDEVTLCTKVSTGSAPDNIHRAVAASLERLGIDQLDIYKLHSPDASTPIAETLDALTAEVNEGRIDVIGCSNYSASQLQEALDASAAHGYARFEITQPPYNMVLREHEEDLFPLCTRTGVALTPHSPLGNGFLTGKYTPDQTKIPKGSRMDIAPGHMELYFHEQGFRIHDRLRDKAAELGVPMVRLAMAWAMSHPDVTAVLIGARTPEHIDNALAAYEMGLDPALRAEMSA